MVNGVDHLEAKTFIIIVYSIREDEWTGLFSEFLDGEDGYGINFSLYFGGSIIETRGGGEEELDSDPEAGWNVYALSSPGSATDGTFTL